MANSPQNNETTKTQEYGFRNQLLVGEMEDTLLEVFHRTFSKNPQLLYQELQKKQRELLKLNLFKHEKVLVLPTNGNSVHSSKFDITLLSKLVRKFCNLSKNDDANVVCIKDARNESNHCTKKNVSKNFFNKIYNKVEQPMLDLGASQKQLDYIKNVRITDQQTKEMTKRNQQSNVAFNYNYIPPVKNFFSREEDIQNLHQQVIESKKTQMLGVVICGYGGNGKSEMARAYWKKHKAVFEDIVVWINCQTYATMENSFYEIGVQCGIQDIKNINGTFIPIKEAVYLVYNHFARQKSGSTARKVLFVMDNVHEQNSLKDFLPTSPTITPYILITSQCRNWDSRFDVLPLDVFTKEDSVQFLKANILGKNDDDKIMDLSQHLCCHPLALQQAVSYINKNYLSINNYLSLLDKIPEDLLSEPTNDFGNPSVMKTLTLTFNKLEEISDPHTLLLLNIMAHFDGKEIHKGLLFMFCSNNLLLLNKSLSLLQKYSLININDFQMGLYTNAFINSNLSLQQTK